MKPRVRVDVQTGTVERSKVLRVTACGKQGYTSKKIAKAQAKAQSKASGEQIEAYHCWKRTCHCWHLGHVPGSPRKVRDGRVQQVRLIAEHA